MSTDVLNGLVLAYLLGVFTPIAIQFCRYKIPEIKAGMKLAKAIKSKNKKITKERSPSGLLSFFYLHSAARAAYLGRVTTPLSISKR